MVDAERTARDYAIRRGVHFGAVAASAEDGERRVQDGEAAQGRSAGGATWNGWARGMRLGVSDFPWVKGVGGREWDI